MIGLDALYIVVGLMFGAFALSHACDRGHPRRWRSALFWGVYAVAFLAGSWLPDVVNGLLVLVMVALAALKLHPGAVATTGPAERQASAARLGNRLFLPVLVIPVTTLLGSLLMPDGRLAGMQVIEVRQVTLVFLTLGAVLALVAGLALLRRRPALAFREGRRLADAVGWAAVLPQMLAALGALFAVAGVGQVVAKVVTDIIPINGPLSAAALYAIGMALFTMIMGNAFAAFPVMTAGIGLPLIVQRFGGDPAVMAAIGMLSGFCGTLMTPMAANFNIVPAVILELADRNAVIKVQAPTALILLAANIVILALCAFPR